MSIQILVRLYRDPISNIKLWTVIHNTAVADCCVIEPTLTDEINKISSLSFSVYAGHPQIANLIMLVTTLPIIISRNRSMGSSAYNRS